MNVIRFIRSTLFAPFLITQPFFCSCVCFSSGSYQRCCTYVKVKNLTEEREGSDGNDSDEEGRYRTIKATVLEIVRAKNEILGALMGI